ncbi:MAG TPA: hypothetical protein VLJ10_03630 [Candidatus Bathyarchaeia archaeon]|nr:hypothetical protein [Candidatus Bathyarchaeia archaeon]
MQLWRFIKGMFGVTVLALIYIHMQMNIYALAYEGKQREEHIVRLKEQNTRVANDIFQLKSASHLGRKLLDQDAQLKFCDQNSVVRMASTRVSTEQSKLASDNQSKTNPFMKLFTWRSPVAHAEERESRKPWAKR